MPWWYPFGCIAFIVGGILIFLPTLINDLMPLFTEKKQTLHDMMAGTIVVKN